MRSCIYKEISCLLRLPSAYKIGKRASYNLFQYAVNYIIAYFLTDIISNTYIESGCKIRNKTC